MATPLQRFQKKLGIGQSSLKNVGYNYAPTLIRQGETQESIGQSVLDKLDARKETGRSIYGSMRQRGTNRVASDLVNKSAGLQFDEFGRPTLNLGDFGTSGKATVKGISERGNLATQTAEAKQAFQNAVNMQNLGSYGFSGYEGGTATDIPGAAGGNTGAQAAAKALQVAKNKTAYVWGGNSLSQGVDCSGLVQQIYRGLGINVPRTTYEQAKNGKQVPVSQIRPGDLVFYRNGSRGPEHVGIYVGNGKIVHAANSKLGVIQSNLNNSNGAPTMVLRPY